MKEGLDVLLKNWKTSFQIKQRKNIRPIETIFEVSFEENRIGKDFERLQGPIHKILFYVEHIAVWPDC